MIAIREKDFLIDIRFPFGCRFESSTGGAIKYDYGGNSMIVVNLKMDKYLKQRKRAKLSHAFDKKRDVITAVTPEEPRRKKQIPHQRCEFEEKR